MHPKPDQRPLFVPTETVAVAVRTSDQLLVGFLHARPQKRLKDELNGNSIVSVTPLNAIGPAAAAWSKLLALEPEPASKSSPKR